jgi:hypothetical protein
MTTAPMIIGIDLGKNWFHLIGVDERGGTVLRRKMNRTQLAAFAVTASPCVIATEACPGSQYWGRVFAKAGHEVRILPAQFVKPCVKSNKNDFHDAEAIAEAAGRVSMRCVPLKTDEQLELQALHRGPSAVYRRAHGRHQPNASPPASISVTTRSTRISGSPTGRGRPTGVCRAGLEAMTPLATLLARPTNEATLFEDSAS